MAVSKKARGLYWRFFDGFETCCANFISMFQENRYLKKYITKKPCPKEFKESYIKYWNQFKVKNVRGGYSTLGTMLLKTE